MPQITISKWPVSFSEILDLMKIEDGNLVFNTSDIIAIFKRMLKEWNMFQIFSCHLISICFEK